MIRKLSLAVALAAILNPMASLAMGLGGIQLHSALNQQLKAEIALDVVEEGDVDGLIVKLADTDAFTKAGLERPHFLSDLRFRARTKENGKSVIEVTSVNPIREPYLNFLIEVNWSKGKLQKEFTLLLDPPTSLKRSAPKVKAPRRESAPTPAPVRRPTAPKAPAMEQSAPARQPEGGDYLVMRNDTLWRIAEAHRQQGATVEQTMQAIYQANPEAFGSDMNLLKEGAILRMPAGEAAGAPVAADRRRQDLSQVSPWQETSVSDTVMDKATKPEGASDAAASKAPAQKSEVKEEARVELYTPKPGEQGKAADADVVDRTKRLENELVLAREASEAARAENSELKSRLRDLEGQISDLERLLKLKNDQFAQLQAMAEQRAKEAEARDQAATQAQPVTETKAETTPETKPEQPSEVSHSEQMPPQQVAETTPPADTLPKATEVEPTPQQPPVDQALAEGAEKAKQVAQDSKDSIAALQEKAKAVAQEMGEQANKGADAIAAQAEQMKQSGQQALESLAEQAKPAQEGQTAAVEQATEQPADKDKTLQEVTETVPGKIPVKVTDLSAKPQAEGGAVETPTEQKPQAAKKPKVELPPLLVEEPGLLEGLLSNQTLLLGGGGLLGLLGLLALLRRRQASNGKADDTVPNLHSELADDDSIPAFEDSEPQAVARGGTTNLLDDEESSSFLTDFTPSELEQLGDETADVDPASEADVYIAYGRYQQAQELMREAIERDPGRAELKLKMLEVLHASNAKDEFVRLAGEYSAQGVPQQDPAGWNKVAKLGREIAPNNPLFGGVLEQPAPVAAKAAAPSAMSMMDDDFTGPDSLSLTRLAEEFDLDKELENSKPLSDEEHDEFAKELAAAGDLDDLDFDSLGSLSGEDDDLQDISAQLAAFSEAPKGRGAAAAMKPVARSSVQDLDELSDISSQLNKGYSSPQEIDLEAELKDLSASFANEAPEPTSADDLALEFDLGSFGLQEAEQKESDDYDTLSWDSINNDTSSHNLNLDDLQHFSFDEPVQDSGHTGIDELNLDDNLNLDENLFGAALGSVGDNEFDLNNLEVISDLQTETMDGQPFISPSRLNGIEMGEEMDEVQTKIELAEAYLEMGDGEGAKSILDEVMQEGSNAQRARAQELLKQAEKAK